MMPPQLPGSRQRSGPPPLDKRGVLGLAPNVRVQNPRGETTVDARKHDVGGNSTHGSSSMFNGEGDTFFRSRHKHYSRSPITKIVINPVNPINPDLEAEIMKQPDTPRTRSKRSTVDIRTIAGKFQDKTKGILSSIYHSLNKYQRYSERATRSLNKLAKDKSMINFTKLIDYMLLILERQQRHNMLTDRDYRIFGLVLESTNNGAEPPETTSKRVEDILRDLQGARGHLERASSLLKNITSKMRTEGQNCQRTIQDCRELILSGERNHGRFHALFIKHVEQFLPSRITGDLDKDERRELGLLVSCRHLSAALCRQLGSLCDEHDDHQVYVNLEKIQRIEQGFHFELAFKRRDQDGHGFVWIQAAIRVNEDSPSTSFLSTADPMDTSPSPRRSPNLSVSPSETMDMERPCFCIGSLENGMNFRFRIGTGTQVQQRPFPSGSSGTSLMSLAEWMNKAEWMQKGFPTIERRTRLACLVAEAVLMFELTLWSPASLTSQTIMLIEYKGYETHVRVCLPQQSYIGSPSSTQPSPVSQVLYHLGVVLLELGFLEEIAEEDVKNKCDEEHLRDLEDEMGRRYADVVRFCLRYQEDTHGDINMSSEGIYDSRVQEYFYQRVIRLLKQDGELMKSFGIKS